MKELASEDLPYERQMVPRDEARAFFAARHEPLKVQLIEEKTEGQSEVSCYTIKDRETFIDFCVGPHVPSTGRLKAFKLLSTSNAYWKGDARNQPMQRIYGTAFLSDKELKEHLTPNRRGEKARSPQARSRARPLLVPSVGAGRTVLAAEGHDARASARQLHARGARPRRLCRSARPAGLQQGPVGDVGTLAALSSEHVPAAGGGRDRAVGAQADELPGTHAAVRQRGAQLSRPAAAHSRTERPAPHGGVGVAEWPDARAGVHHGRRAHLPA